MLHCYWLRGLHHFVCTASSRERLACRLLCCVPLTRRTPAEGSAAALQQRQVEPGVPSDHASFDEEGGARLEEGVPEADAESSEANGPHKPAASTRSDVDLLRVLFTCIGARTGHFVKGGTQHFHHNFKPRSKCRSCPPLNSVCDCD